MNLIKQYHEYLNNEKYKNLSKEFFVKEVVVDAFFIFDTNSILYPLKNFLTPDKVFEALNQVRVKTFIPFVSQVEYLNNESQVVQGTYKLERDTNQVIESIEKQNNLLKYDKIKDLVKEKLFEFRDKKFSNDYDSDKIFEVTDRYWEQIETNIRPELNKIISEMNNLVNGVKKGVTSNFSWEDIISKEDYDGKELKNRLENWLNDVELGKCYDKNILQDYVLKIKKRYDAKISPGYMDLKDKEGKYIQFGNLIMKSSYSDALFWLESLDYLKKNSIRSKYLVIVSSELKEDWVVDGKVSSLKDDLVRECLIETGMIPLKIDVKDLVAHLTNMTEEELRHAYETFNETRCAFSLYGGEIQTPLSQREMMISIFESILKNESVNKYLELPCLQLASEHSMNSIYNSFERVYDKDKKEVLLGLNLNLKDKLVYIYRLLELRVPGSASQLKFFDNEVQNQWTKVCKKMKKK